MTPSSKHWLFAFTVFLQGNTGSSFSRDIQDSVPKQPVKGQCPINPPWQPHSFNTVWIHQDLYFIHTTWEDHSTQSISPFGRYTSHQTINAAFGIQYRSATSLKESPGRISRQSSAIDFTSHRGQYKILLQSR
ncbi:hypothetical protein O181_112183 [Austropuccinia psidii MF-1]|uniref:Uncharacterized protein n=1 Tax=Austropuccinia psidii MF-1 TaxID=1389203 RepID=A0A9Q3JZZ5_9BASI|nr:hypothetical protein [Austropuccinia psidii MF-1]